MVKISKDLVKLILLQKRRVWKENLAKLGLLVSDKKVGVVDEVRFLRRSSSMNCCEYFSGADSGQVAKAMSTIVKERKVLRGLILLHALNSCNEGYDYIGYEYSSAIKKWGMNTDGFLFLICADDELFAFVKNSGDFKKVELSYV